MGKKSLVNAHCLLEAFSAIVVKVKYQNNLVMVEWVGTHAEYGKKNFRRA